MTELDAGQSGVIAPLFMGFSDTLVLSYLQGHFGRGWTDDVDAPACGLIRVQDFAFVAGDARLQGAEGLLRGMPGAFTLLVPGDDAWGALTQRVFGECCKAITRYAIMKEPGCFDRARLTSFAGALPAGFRLRRIDEALYARIMEQPDIADFCGAFADSRDYARRGLGYVALDEREAIAAGASSFTMYDGGIEIEVDTREPYRRRGLATACAAALILACLDRGLYPSWDAANTASVALAEKLGYHFSHEYVTYVIRK